MTQVQQRIAATSLIACGLLVVYWQMLVKLVDAWANDGNYSHGFLVIPLAAYFTWERRGRLAGTPIQPSLIGLAGFAGGIALLIAGMLGAELFLTRVSFVVVIASILLYLFGWAWLRAMAFPLAFLLLMIPIPALIFNQIAFPLQLLASQVGVTAISAASIPVLREGNVLILANTTLEVAEACSGIRSLISLITLGLVYGYFTDERTWVRVAIVASAIPVAIVANGTRVAGTGIAAHWMGASAAEGFFHDFSGWVIFILAFMMIFVLQRAIARFAPAPAVAPGV